VRDGTLYDVTKGERINEEYTVGVKALLLCTHRTRVPTCMDAAG
jgi:hypothetical protein